MQRARHGRWAPAILVLVAVGCHKEGPALLPTWSSAQAMYQPRSGSSNGFDDLALAAETAEKEVKPDYLNRVWFTPGMREAVIKQTGSSVGRVGAAVSKGVDFEFVSRGPFEPSPYARGWRLLGRSIVWRIDSKAAKEDYNGAARDAILATKFGFGLTGGDAMDASLGFATVDEARRSLAPHLGRMGAGQLNELASGLERALDARPPLTETFGHEKENMLRSVQYVQEAFVKGEFSDVRERLGADIRDAVQYLKDLREKSPTKQAAYFQGFAAEANERARWLQAVSELPLEERKRDPGPQMAEERPWRRFAKHFFGAGEPLLAMRDATVARTRMMILECRILAQVKAKKAAPADLSEFDKELKTDPFTGSQFIYRASGTEFTLYSVGEDLKDDGGETDESFTSKDLTIERPTE